MKGKIMFFVFLFGMTGIVSGAWCNPDEKGEQSNRQLLCANLFRQMVNTFERSSAADEKNWDKGRCRYLTLETAEASYYLITSCLQTKCGTANTPCRVPPEYFQNSSCPYAADYIDIPAFLGGFARVVDQYGGETDAWEPHMQEIANVPLCIASPDILRNAALGCERQNNPAQLSRASH